jgi:predicted XRE-type DNA-binding protein
MEPQMPSHDLNVNITVDTAHAEAFVDSITAAQADTHASVITTRQVLDLYNPAAYGDLLVLDRSGVWDHPVALISSARSAQSRLYADEDDQCWYGNPDGDDGEYHPGPDALLVIAATAGFPDLLGPDELTADGALLPDIAEGLAQSWAEQYALPLAVADARRMERLRQEAQQLADRAARDRALAVFRVVEVAGSQAAAAAWLGISQPTVNDLARKARQPDLTRMQVHHRDGDARNIDPANLELRETPTD